MRVRLEVVGRLDGVTDEGSWFKGRGTAAAATAVGMTHYVVVVQTAGQTRRRTREDKKGTLPSFPIKVARGQNLIPSFPWIVPGWRVWGDQILPYGNLDWEGGKSAFFVFTRPPSSLAGCLDDDDDVMRHANRRRRPPSLELRSASV